MSAKILIVDDKMSLRSLVKSYLTQEGFEVVEAENGKDALFVARREKPDLILLDLMMPEMGGHEFMRLHEKESDAPIIILTARVEENDRVVGLELGADDYITKPFSLREMVARIHAVLRRADKTQRGSDTLRYAGITLDRRAHIVTVNDHPVILTPTEFDLLGALMSSPGRVLSRVELLEHLNDDMAIDGAERIVDVHIHNLRGKVEADPANPRYVETVYGIGYRFNEVGQPS